MKSALIGATGFVGSTLKRQRSFDAFYHSTNIADIAGAEFDLVVCAAASAQKWLANKEPISDLVQIEKLIEHLATFKCKQFVLISTVDVFANPVNVDENTNVSKDGLHAYGLNRRLLETRAAQIFPNTLIVRLPGLVGPGLKKNVIYDFLNDNNTSAIDHRGVFQFYPMVNLWRDISIALEAQLSLVHLTAAPLNVEQISRSCFGKSFNQIATNSPARYDVKTCHAELFGGRDSYQYSDRESLLSISWYAQSESKTAKR